MGLTMNKAQLKNLVAENIERCFVPSGLEAVSL
jgi:hypothetical protein